MGRVVIPKCSGWVGTYKDNPIPTTYHVLSIEWDIKGFLRTPFTPTATQIPPPLYIAFKKKNVRSVSQQSARLPFL